MTARDVTGHARAREILAAVARHGVSLSVRDGRIVARPAGRLPADIRSQIAAHKVELVRLLVAERRRREGPMMYRTVAGTPFFYADPEGEVTHELDQAAQPREPEAAS